MNLINLSVLAKLTLNLCDSSGQPKEGVLEKAESCFESYSGDNVTVIGQTKIYARNIQNRKFLVTRIYVIARDRGSILLSNTVSQWLGLIAVLYENKAVPVGKFVASVTREDTDGGMVEAYTTLETDPEMTESQDNIPPSQRAITVPKKRKWTKKARPVVPASMDVTPETTNIESQPSATERTEADSLQEQNSVTSGEVCQQETPSDLGPFRSKEGGKDSPKSRADSIEIPKRKYYRPAAGAKTYRMNDQGQLQCQQDPKDVTRVGSVKGLPVSRRSQYSMNL